MGYSVKKEKKNYTRHRSHCYSMVLTLSSLLSKQFFLKKNIWRRWKISQSKYSLTYIQKHMMYDYDQPITFCSHTEFTRTEHHINANIEIRKYKPVLIFFLFVLLKILSYIILHSPQQKTTIQLLVWIIKKKKF